MKKKSKYNSYLLFHLNLSFSSVDKSKHKTIIKKCYKPILNLAKRGFPLAIEITGSTLERINQIDRNFVKDFKLLIDKNLIELIGSGYSQIIGALHDPEITKINLKEGNKVYKLLLDTCPENFLINEMALSSGLLRTYEQCKVKSIIFDSDNTSLSSKLSKNYLFSFSRINIQNNKSIKVIWSDSIMFQRFQRFIHGEITENEYLRYIEGQRKNLAYLPIYTNDAEVFNFRPGRFSTEQKIYENEWQKIEDILYRLVSMGFNFLLPRDLPIKSKKIFPGFPTSAAHPVLVKKQSKYNILRWSVSGRNDAALNLIISQLVNALKNKKIKNNSANLKKILYFASSDLRTHITDSRWKTYVADVNKFYKENFMNPPFGHKKSYKDPLSDFIKITDLIQKKSFNLTYDKKFIYINNKKLRLILNKYKGLSIESLSFKDHSFIESIKSFPAGYFKSIDYGVDFFSSSLILDKPLERKKVTDLTFIKPFIKFESKAVQIATEIKCHEFKFYKIYTIFNNSNKVQVDFKFRNIKDFIGILRVGNFTFNTSDFFQKNTISSKIGSNNFDNFELQEDFDHGRPVSSYVSGNCGMPSTNGEFIVKNSSNLGIKFSFNTNESYAIPIVAYKKLKPSSFFRLSYSLRELDDTSKLCNSITDFGLTIRPIS